MMAFDGRIHHVEIHVNYITKPTHWLLVGGKYCCQGNSIWLLLKPANVGSNADIIDKQTNWETKVNMILGESTLLFYLFI